MTPIILLTLLFLQIRLHLHPRGVYAIVHRVTAAEYLLKVVTETELNRGVSRIVGAKQAEDARAMVEAIDELPIRVIGKGDGGFDDAFRLQAPHPP